MSKVIIGVDLGGTRLRAACLDYQLNIMERQETKTLAHEGLEATLQRMKDQIRAVWSDDNASVAGIGISAPGPLNPRTGVVIAPPNLPGWHDVPLADLMRDEFGVPVYVGNDANVAALAETAVGAAKGYRHVIYITVSTGIGSGIINDSKLILGRTGLGCEAGHIIMIVENDQISSLEKEAAGPALARQAQQRIKDGEQSVLLAMAKGEPDSIDARMVGDAANGGDGLALSIVKRGGKIVGLGLVSLLHLFNPEVVVIGGGVSYIGDIWFDAIRKAVQEQAIDEDYWNATPIVPSKISEDVSILGAAILVMTQGGRKNLAKVLSKQGIT